MTSPLLQIVACALLMFDLSGAAMLAPDEGCRPGAADSARDACGPTCLRCACCVQPLESPPALSVSRVTVARITPAGDVIPLAGPAPAEILHVPRAI